MNLNKNLDCIYETINRNISKDVIDMAEKNDSSKKYYKIENESLNKISSNIKRNADTWNKDTKKLFMMLKTMGESNDFVGAAADATRQYIDVVHSDIRNSIETLIKLHYDNFVLFYNQLLDIEDDKFARIEEKEITEINNKIKQYKKNIGEIKKNIENSLKNISDIFPCNSVICTSSIFQGGIIEIIDNLNTSIKKVDLDHQYKDFENLDLLSKSLEKLLKECLEKNRDFKTNFTKLEWNELDLVKELSKNSSSVNEEYGKLDEEKISEAKKRLADTEKKISDYKLRKVTAGVAEGLIGGVCVAITALAAAVIVPAGFTVGATILIMAGIGVITGATKEATSVIADEFVENGNLKNMDWENYDKKIAVAGTIGGVNGAISGTLSGVGSGVEQSVTEKVMISTAEEVINGKIERGINAGVDISSDLLNGNTNVKTAIEDFQYEVNNPKDVGKDILSGSIKALEKETSETILKKTGIDAEYMKSENVKQRARSAGIKSATDSVITGTQTRTINNVIDGYELKESYEKAAEPSKIIKDATKGYIKGMEKEKVKNQFENKQQSVIKYSDFKLTNNNSFSLAN